MTLVYKKKFEDRAAGVAAAVDHPLNIVWGPTPKTDGRNVYLPDRPVGIWDSKQMIQCGFSHEIAHILFQTDIVGMHDWIETWGNDGSKYNWHDPYGLIKDVAEHVIQVTEDQRIESLYGEIRRGARERFREVSHPRIADENALDDPANSYLLMRCSKWNMECGEEPNYYSDIADKWGSDWAEFFYTMLDKVEGAGMDMTFLVAEKVMKKIYPWYEERLRFVETDDEIQNLQGSLEEIESERGY